MQSRTPNSLKNKEEAEGKEVYTDEKK